MYQVINPAFDHLTGLVSWYCGTVYFSAYIIAKRSFEQKTLLCPVRSHGDDYVGFIAFMLLGRKETDYLIVDTLMLSACGIFDLFWCSILGKC